MSPVNRQQADAIDRALGLAGVPVARNGVIPGR